MSDHPTRQLPPHAELARLARDDPAAYEALRQELIEDLIEGAPEGIKPRLRGIQFRVDGVRRCSRTALGATVKIYKLMWESFGRLNEEMSAFRDGASPRAPLAAVDAKIIEFRPLKTLSDGDPLSV